MKYLPILGAGIAAALAISATATINAPAPVTGTVTGTVMFEGEVPKAKALSIKEEQSAGCCAPGVKLDDGARSLMISKDGGIANVVITLTVDGAKVELPSEPVEIDQVGCRFEPHLSVVHVGTTVRYKNSDTISHNVHTYALKNEGLNKTVAAGGKLDQKLEKAEAVRIACDIHPWMESYVFVTEGTHFTFTGSDGSFKLEGVPAGDYKLQIWHEKLGKGKGSVTVKADGSSDAVSIKMGAKKKGGRRRR